MNRGITKKGLAGMLIGAGAMALALSSGYVVGTMYSMNSRIREMDKILKRSEILLQKNLRSIEDDLSILIERNKIKMQMLQDYKKENTKTDEESREAYRIYVSASMANGGDPLPEEEWRKLRGYEK